MIDREQSCIAEIIYAAANADDDDDDGEMAMVMRNINTVWLLFIRCFLAKYNESRN